MLRFPAFPLVLVLTSLLTFGCSALIDPDEADLGGGAEDGIMLMDGGTDVPPGSAIDSGTPDDEDSGTPPDEEDAGTPGPDDCDGLPRCDGDTLWTCEDGEPVRAVCPGGCDAASASCGAYVPSNVSPDLWDEAVDDVVLTEPTGFDTDECEGSRTGRVVEQDGGGRVCALRLRGFTIEETGSLRVRGSLPLVIMASADVVIDGTLDVSAEGSSPGAGGFAGGVAPEPDGQGERPGEGGEAVDEDPQFGGGGGGALCGSGGRGGDGGGRDGGDGGDELDDWDLSPLVGGSGGGRGRGSIFGPTALAGLGGGGGGAIQISALGTIRIGGEVLAAGGGGGAGEIARFGGGRALPGSGGGGGSGGAILLEAPRVSITGRMNAAGGGGGGAAGEGDGEAGQDGVLSDTRPAGGASEVPIGGEGGQAGGGSRLDGEDGADADVRGGGGGGGAGCILVRTGDGSVDDGGSVSPSAEPGFRNLRVRTE